MDYTISIDSVARLTALARARSAYNARNSEVTEAQFVQMLVDGQLDSLVKAYVTTTVTRLAFMQRLTADERIAIRTAAQSNAAVQDYLELLNVSEEVDVTHPTTVAGVQQLEASGLLAAGRAAEILAL